VAHVPAPYDSQEGRQGPPLLVPGAQRARRPTGDTANRCAPWRAIPMPSATGTGGHQWAHTSRPRVRSSLRSACCTPTTSPAVPPQTILGEQALPRSSGRYLLHRHFIRTTPCRKSSNSTLVWLRLATRSWTRSCRRIPQCSWRQAVCAARGIANVAELRLAAPLPETADELCDVAKAVGAGEAANRSPPTWSAISAVCCVAPLRAPRGSSCWRGRPCDP
jgi:hypothetical protein